MSTARSWCARAGLGLVLLGWAAFGGGCANHTPIDQIRTLTELHESGQVPIGRWSELEPARGSMALGPEPGDVVHWDRRGFQRGTLISFGREGSGARLDRGLIAVENVEYRDAQAAIFLASYRTPGGGASGSLHVRALAAAVDPATGGLVWRVGGLSEIAEHQVFRVGGDLPWSPPSLDWDDTLRCFECTKGLGSVTVRETLSGSAWSVALPPVSSPPESASRR